MATLAKTNTRLVAPLPVPTRAAHYWQLLALLVVVLPQMDRLPPWLDALLVLACCWRLPFMAQRLPAPNAFLRVLLLGVGMAGVFYSHHTFLGPEGGVSFLMVCVALKMLESRTQRDFFVSAILDFFVLATAFLFSQSLMLTLYVGVASVFVLAALLSLQQRESAGVKLTLRRAGILVLQTIPLMLVLFVFFPRLPPLWTLNFSQGSGHTGMSDSMSPGDISSLSESAEVAFRVEFDGAIPPSSQLYWRGLVLSHFDGQRWTQDESMSSLTRAVSAEASMPAWISAPAADAKAVKYHITLEATDQPWLFALAVPSSASNGVMLTRDFRLVYHQPLFERLSYDVVSWPQRKIDAQELPAWMRHQALQLPPAGNPVTREMAQRWLNGSGSQEKYVRDVLDWFRQERFYYTLQPPALGENRIDDFLFHTRRGFCEHYASSFVFLMRAAGIPARVVAGYQGGEKSPLANYWLVRQLDAHAWAEVWLPGQGWVNVDPTSAVAPDRIQRGAPQMANDPAYWGNSGGSKMRYNNYRLLKSLRQFSDYVNYRWHRDVLGYDTQQQEGLMMRLLGDSGLMRRLAVMGIAFVLIAGLLLLWALRGHRREQHPLDKAYYQYCARLARRGVIRAAGEGPQAFARRIATTAPAMAAEADEFASLYMALRYRPAVSVVRKSASKNANNDATKAEKLLEKRLQRLAKG